MDDWTYTGEIDDERIARLLGWRSFEEIVDEMIRTGSVTSTWWEPARAMHLRGTHRASAELLVSSHVYDAFFNAPNGYRGEFTKPNLAGRIANRMLLDKIEPKLKKAFEATSPAPLALVLASLRASEAKAWINETEIETQPVRSRMKIAHEVWERRDPGGSGLDAPLGSRIEFKGGWVDEEGNERINPEKANRETEVADKGDT